MRTLVLSLLLASSAAFAACGGTLSDVDAGTSKVPVTCGAKTCAAGEICLVTTSGGGPCQLPDDAGLCPNGTHSNGCCSNVTTTYDCKGVPSACGGALACPCASTLCQCGGCAIADAGVMQCTCLYP
jgi:hypothetical protein